MGESFIYRSSFDCSRTLLKDNCLKDVISGTHSPQKRQFDTNLEKVDLHVAPIKNIVSSKMLE